MKLIPKRLSALKRGHVPRLVPGLDQRGGDDSMEGRSVVSAVDAELAKVTYGQGAFSGEEVDNKVPSRCSHPDSTSSGPSDWRRELVVENNINWISH